MNQIIDINRMRISLPGYLTEVKSMPEDPVNSRPFMGQSENAECFVILYPLSIKEAMPLDKPAVIDGIHETLSDNQGLIEVEAGDDYIYIIVKYLKEEGGVQYILTLQKWFDNKILNIQGYFDEIGTTGVRDSTIYSMLREKGTVGTEGNPFAGWMEDPYEKSFTKGLLMNKSESAQFDKLFLNHPLSICRDVVNTILSIS